jgi:putative flavoprotein involved in K+ transport
MSGCINPDTFLIQICGDSGWLLNLIMGAASGMKVKHDDKYARGSDPSYSGHNRPGRADDMTTYVDTIVIGGGQGGLSTSYYLKQQGREHVVLEQTPQAAPVWRNRWDSFTLNTPNWMTRLPGAEYQGNDPDGFMPRAEIVAYFEAYIERFELPVRYGIRVTSVEPIEAGYRVSTDEGEFEAANVVIATGLHQQPKIPPFSTNLPAEIHQLHSSEYRNPEALPTGAVLVVGSAQSGCQIAEELYQSGRKVYLSVSSSPRLPRRYRGKDITWWLEVVGFFDKTVDQLPSPKAKFAASAHSTGKDGGHTINLHQFMRDGVVLLGHIQSIQGYRIALAPDMKENLAKADKFEVDFVKQIDEYIASNEIEAPIENLPELRDGFQAEEITDFDLNSTGISSVIWTTGFKFDFGLVKLSAFDEDGYPLQKRGVTEFAGLYFIGLPFLTKFKSGLLAGVGDDAAHVAEHISSRTNLEAHIQLTA